jgi:putative transcriptional regulator
MQLCAGKILISTPSMNDSNFIKTMLFITEYNENGAMAFVINKMYERPLNALQEFSNSPAFALFDGGPVDKEHLFFIHRCNDIITGGKKITDEIYVGGDFKKAITHINNKTITNTHIKIFIGYCGWDAGELEAEIEEGSWEIGESSTEIVFTEDAD